MLFKFSWATFRVLSRRNRIFFYLVIACLLICGGFTAVFLVAGFARFDIGKVIDDAAQGRDGVALLGHAYNIDVTARQVQMSWLVLGCGNLAISDFPSYGSHSCGRPSLSVDFYFEGATNASGSYDPTSSLWFYNSTMDAFYIQTTVEFQTQHLLEVTAWYGQDQQYAYPFDTYILNTFFEARTSDTNVSLPTLFARIADATSNFEPVLGLDADIRTIAINGSYANAHGVQYSFNRVVLSQLFVMVLFVVNWLLTAVVLYIGVSAYEGLPMSEGVLVLPLSVILTIPALRALWVDAPAFGLLLDSCGTFLQMVIVSLASLYLVVNFGLRRKKAAQKDEENAKADREEGASIPLLDKFDLHSE